MKNRLLLQILFFSLITFGLQILVGMDDAAQQYKIDQQAKIAKQKQAEFDAKVKAQMQKMKILPKTPTNKEYTKDQTGTMEKYTDPKTQTSTFIFTSLEPETDYKTPQPSTGKSFLDNFNRGSKSPNYPQFAAEEGFEQSKKPQASLSEQIKTQVSTAQRKIKEFAEKLKRDAANKIQDIQLKIENNKQNTEIKKAKAVKSLTEKVSARHNVVAQNLENITKQQQILAANPKDAGTLATLQMYRDETKASIKQAQAEIKKLNAEIKENEKKEAAEKKKMEKLEANLKKLQKQIDTKNPPPELSLNEISTMDTKELRQIEAQQAEFDKLRSKRTSIENAKQKVGWNLEAIRETKETLTESLKKAEELAQITLEDTRTREQLADTVRACRELATKAKTKEAQALLKSAMEDAKEAANNIAADINKLLRDRAKLKKQVNLANKTVEQRQDIINGLEEIKNKLDPKYEDLKKLKDAIAGKAPKATDTVQDSNKIDTQEKIDDLKKELAGSEKEFNELTSRKKLSESDAKKIQELAVSRVAKIVDFSKEEQIKELNKLETAIKKSMEYFDVARDGYHTLYETYKFIRQRASVVKIRPE